MIVCDLNETPIARWQAVIPNEFLAKLAGMAMCRRPIGELGWEIARFPSGHKLLVRRRPGALEFLVVPIHDLRALPCRTNSSLDRATGDAERFDRLCRYTDPWRKLAHI